jgi:hypothetical protein
MSYYAVLSVATVLFLALGAAIWARTKSPAFVVGLAFIYYWTLWGGWFIVYDLSGGESGMQYSHFYYRLFPLHLDADYFSTLVLYSTFILLIEITLLFSIRGGVPQLPTRPIRIFHTKMLSIAAVSGMLSFLIIRNSFGTASSLGLSGYQFVRNDPSIARFFTLHQQLNRISLFTATMGLAIYLSGRNAKYIVGRGNSTHGVSYLVVVLGIFIMNLMLGDRHDLVAGFLASGLFYLVNARKPKKITLVVACSTALLAVGLVGLTRGVAVENTVREMGISKTAISALATYAMSNEPFAAHMSMYGSLHKNVELTYGSSIFSFLFSAIPRVLLLNRPVDIASYYALAVGAVEGQGFTIHHSTGWYLNFGTVGVILGAVLFGWTWASRWTRFQQVDRARGYWRLIFHVIAFWTFTASISGLLRSGPEAYKAVLLEAFLIPTLILGFAGSRFVMKFSRPRLLFGEDSLGAVRPGTWMES